MGIKRRIDQKNGRDMLVDLEPKWWQLEYPEFYSVNTAMKTSNSLQNLATVMKMIRCNLYHVLGWKGRDVILQMFC